jgi:hypothetical protein
LNFADYIILGAIYPRSDYLYRRQVCALQKAQLFVSESSKTHVLARNMPWLKKQLRPVTNSRSLLADIRLALWQARSLAELKLQP